MGKPQNAVSTGQDLRVAPAAIRCEQLIEHDDETVARCSRFTIRLPGGERDSYCISHSRTHYASMLRCKGARSRSAARAEDAERRAELAHALIPRVWRNPREIQRSRWRISQAVIRGDVTIGMGKYLQSMVRDAEAQMRSMRCDWQGAY